MIDSLKPYEKMKPSGLPWLGNIPAHWETRRLRDVAELRVSSVDKHVRPGQKSVRLCNYVDVSTNERILEGPSYMLSTASDAEIDRFRLAAGDVVITKDSEMWDDIAVPALVEYAAPDFVCGYHLAILRPRDNLAGGFLHRAIEEYRIATQFHVRANGVTRFGLSQGAIKNVSIPLPPAHEQESIARFLDYMGARLSRAIEAKRETIGLLNEQKQAIVRQAVTRGLDPTVPLKPSDLSWLDQIPVSWEVLRAKFIFDVIEERSATGTEELLTVSSAHGIIPRSTSNVTMFKAKSYIGHKLCSPGDLVVNSLWAWAGGLGVSSRRGIISTAYSVYRPKPEFACYAEYLHEALRSVAYKCELAVRSKGIWVSRLQLSDESFMAMPVLLPPRAEAEKIIGQLRTSLSGLNSSVLTLEREIELLTEYRTRLTSDVVTGKLDVREAAKALPGLDDEPSDRAEAPSGEREDELAFVKAP